MTSSFEERERAAEGLFARDEELRFIAVRRGLQALGAWAGEGIGLDAEASAAYGTRLVDAFVAGTPEPDLVAQVRTDLERAGKPALSTTVPTVLAQAVATAAEHLRHGPPPAAAAGVPAEDPRAAWDRHHAEQGHGFDWRL